MVLESTLMYIRKIKMFINHSGMVLAYNIVMQDEDDREVILRLTGAQLKELRDKIDNALVGIED